MLPIRSWTEALPRFLLSGRFDGLSQDMLPLSVAVGFLPWYQGL